MRIRCNELEEEKDDLISRKSIVEKNYKILQVKHRKITEKYATLRSQMSSNTTDVVRMYLCSSEVAEVRAAGLLKLMKLPYQLLG